MRPHRGAFRVTLGVVAVTGFAGSAMAQVPPPAAPPPAAAPAPAPAPAPVVAPAPAEVAPAPAPEPLPAPAPVVVAPPPATDPVPPPPPVADVKTEEEDAAPSPLKFLFFADANAGYQTAQQGTAAPWHRAYEWNTPAFTNHNGFQLSFLGLDVNYDAGVFGATTSLRFGPSVPIFYAGAQNSGPFGIDNVTQAFVTVKPIQQLTLDLGQFATIYGAEVSESWRNLNYSRGGLYYGFQPFWHTGLRAKYAFNDMFALTGMIVNGVNNVVNEDKSPSYGIQAAFTPAPEFSLAVGGLFAGNGETAANGFDRFLDVVAVLKLDALTVIGNFDYSQDVAGLGAPDQNSSFYGGSLAVGYAFTNWFALAVRGEHLVDANNRLYKFEGVQDENGVYTEIPDQKVSVTTGTLTLDFKPFPKRKSLIVRADGRYETASKDIFFNGDGEGSGSWFGTTLGVVVTTE